MKLDGSDVVKQIALLAAKLPEHQAQELLAMIDNWKENERSAPREKYIDLLHFSSKSGVHDGRARNVSASGVFIESSDKFEMGEDVQLVMTFISSPDPVRIRGTVVRITPAGIGVRFDLSSQSQKMLMNAIIKKHGQICGR
jgi:Tfp pilus assembly protein PilZ